MGRALVLDPRSVAVLRIAIGLLVLLDLAERVPLLRVFYTDDGFVTRADAVALWARKLPAAPAPWSLHLLSGTAAWQGLLFGAQALCGVALVVGYRARAASVAACVLLFSVCQRNVLAAGGDDWALVAFVFWSMFMPLDGVLSLRARQVAAEPDARGRRAPRGPRVVESFGFTAQLVMTLMFAGLQKVVTTPIWTSGDAVGLLLRDPVLTTVLGQFLGTLPGAVGMLLTYTVLLAELGLPPLLVLPVPASVRVAAIACIAMSLVGFGAALLVGRLPWVVLAALAAHLPGTLWDRCGWRLEPVPAPAPRSGPEPLRIGVTAVLVLHALVDNACRLGRDASEPAWVDAPAGVFVPRQGWGMFRTVDTVRTSDWVVVAAAAPPSHDLTLRLPDGKALTLGPESSTRHLYPGLRWAFFFAQARGVFDDFPQVLRRYAREQCAARSSLSLSEVAIVEVAWRGGGLAHNVLVSERCDAAASRGRRADPTRHGESGP